MDQDIPPLPHKAWAWATFRSLSHASRNRLSKTCNTSTNGTLGGSNITFPLDQPIYRMTRVSQSQLVSNTPLYNLFCTILNRLTLLAVMNFTSMAAGGPLPADHVPDDLVIDQSLPPATLN